MVSQLKFDKFKTQYRGYNKAEVIAFIDEVINMLDALNVEHKQLIKENGILREQIGRFDDIKVQINETLVSAQTVASDIKSQAIKQQEFIIRTAEHNANKVLTEKLREANKLDQEIAVYKAKLKTVINSQLEMLEYVDKYED